MKKILFLIATIICFQSCVSDWAGAYIDHWNDHNTPQPIMDTCASHNLITEPQFIQGALSMDDLDFPWQAVVGPFTDSIHNESEVVPVLTSLFSTWRPQYPVHIDYNPDGNKINVIIKGTNVREHLFTDGWTASQRDELPGWIQVKCYIHVSGVGVRWTFNPQTFYYGGAVSYDQWFIYNDQFPSAQGANVRGMNLDSIQQHRLWVAFLQDPLCKLFPSTARVDWRFNAYTETDSLRIAYHKAGVTPIE